MINRTGVFKKVISKIFTAANLKNVKKVHPMANGTFIQSDMVEKWTDSKWQSEFKYLKEAKMKYVIMGSSYTNGDITETYYPSNLKGTVAKYPRVDIIDMLLRNAEKAGMKVFIGINYSDGWWRKGPRDPRWLYEQMDRGNLIADELYSKYKSRYPKAFYGWYFVYEVDNLNFKTKQDFSILAKAINILLKHQKEKGQRLPFMLSPFMNSKYGSAKAYADNWTYLFQKTSLGEGDVFAPQDSVGGGGLDINQVAEWFKELRRAVNTKPGLLFWANTETFDHTNWTSATLGRFIKQMKFENNYVDNIITFAYSHYYSPNNIDSRFHKNYLEYIKKGYLEKRKPTPPENLAVKELKKGEYQITWGPPEANIDVYGYELYRNGKKIYSTFIQRIYIEKVGPHNSEPIMNFIDKPLLKCTLGRITYEVKAIDFVGNISEGRKVTLKQNK